MTATMRISKNIPNTNTDNNLLPATAATTLTRDIDHSNSKYITSHSISRANEIITEAIDKNYSPTNSPLHQLSKPAALLLAQAIQSSLPKSTYTHDDNGLKMDLCVLPEERHVGDNLIQSGDDWPYWCRYLYGVVLTINFVIFWTLPHVLTSFVWDFGLGKLGGLSEWVKTNPIIRKFAHKYIYTNPKDADYFPQSIWTLLNAAVAFGWAFWCQVSQEGGIKLWQVIIYFHLFVGLRGGGFAGTFALMHREGHVSTFYRPWIRNTIGNVFENWLSSFYGTVPKNASISHTFLHHALQGRSGDSFYQFDLDRGSWIDFFAFVQRIGLHQAGITPYLQLRRHGLESHANAFAIQGLLRYYILFPIIVLSLTQFSLWFFFWFYIQPHLKTVFISAWVNVSFHGFVDYQEDGTPAECVFACEYTNSDLDWLGEDRHLSHHIQGHIHFSEQEENREKLKQYLGHYQASVFTGIGSAVATGLILTQNWTTLAKHFQQFNDHPSPNKPPEDELIRRAYFESKYISTTTKPSVFVGMGRLTEREIAVMLEIRARRREPKWLRGSWLEVEYNALPFVDDSLHNRSDTKFRFD